MRWSLAQAVSGRELSAVKAGEEVVPASELADALKQVRRLQRLLGKKTMENEILREALEYGRAKKWIARSLFAGGRPVKQFCEVLGVARLNVAAKMSRPAEWQVDASCDGRWRLSQPLRQRVASAFGN